MKRKGGEIMKKHYLSLIIALIAILSTGCLMEGGVEAIKNEGTSIQNEDKESTSEEIEEESENSTITILNNAEKIVIKEAIISMGKKYKVYVDDKKIAVVDGKTIKAFGDVFSLYDNEDNVLYYEEQEKRWGVKFNRAAVIKNSEDEVVGYIGEESDTKVFSIGRYLHLYDGDKNEIGVLDQKNFTLNKQVEIYDKNKENKDAKLLYEIDKEFISIGDTYKIEVKDNSVIPVYQIIFAVCIDDAITDAEKAESSKSKK